MFVGLSNPFGNSFCGSGLIILYFSFSFPVEGLSNPISRHFGVPAFQRSSVPSFLIFETVSKIGHVHISGEYL